MNSLSCAFVLASFLIIFAIADEDHIAVPDFKDTNTKEILKWTPPKELVKDYPYYLSGFDEEGSPIWVAEMGKWDTRKSAESGPERERDFKKYIIQFLKRCEESIKLKSTADNPVSDFSIIVDMDGYSARQTASPKGITMALWMARQFEQAFSKTVKLGYIVNGNFVFTTVWNLMKPILGASIYKIEVFGSNKERWIPMLLKTFPKDQLPEWYGGSENFTPVQIYG